MPGANVSRAKDLEFRPAVPSDAPAVRKILNAAYTEWTKVGLHVSAAIHTGARAVELSLVG